MISYQWYTLCRQHHRFSPDTAAAQPTGPARQDVHTNRKQHEPHGSCTRSSLLYKEPHPRRRVLLDGQSNRKFTLAIWLGFFFY